MLSIFASRFGNEKKIPQTRKAFLGFLTGKHNIPIKAKHESLQIKKVQHAKSIENQFPQRGIKPDVVNSLTETALHKVGGPQNVFWFWAFSWRTVSTIFRSGGTV